MASVSVEHAAALIRSGKLVAFPTETVYGLGANALDAAADWQTQQAGQIEQDAAVDFASIGAAQPREGKARVAQPAGLRHIGFGHAELGQRCLQLPVAQQGDAHRAVCAQRLAEQRAYGGISIGVGSGIGGV